MHKGRASAGLVDVVYDDGGKEYRVPRWRIQPEAEQGWQLLYAGPDTSYQVQGLVPVKKKEALFCPSIACVLAFLFCSCLHACVLACLHSCFCYDFRSRVLAFLLLAFLLWLGRCMEGGGLRNGRAALARVLTPPHFSPRVRAVGRQTCWQMKRTLRCAALSCSRRNSGSEFPENYASRTNLSSPPFFRQRKTHTHTRNKSTL